MFQKGKRKSAMMTAEVVPGPSSTALGRVAKETLKDNSEWEQTPEKVPRFSVKRDLIIKDFDKPDPSPEEMHSFMENTFDVRRSFITIEQPIISMVRETYPFLFKERQMLAEFQRVTKLDIDHMIQEYCVKYASGIIDIAKQTAGTAAILRQAETAKHDNAALKQYWDMVTALCLIPVFMKENLVEMVLEIGEGEEVDPKGKVVPILVSKGPIFKSEEFVLVAEEEVLQEFEEFTIGFASLFASYWVFNMQYPQTLNNTYSFVQKVVLSMRDSVPLPPLCKQLLNKLQKWEKFHSQKGKKK